ncbi:uncharacterized protein DUF4439 [Murinocardiopsis flavida]|uniref:Uncharacterized protein DUF4439 n=1 Tax=Murinocardiopsis flavida TaxID=645275 RepID=A0A2P8DV02_9ACTN|nr:ferritin-like domain-containing protein [Murinocardiopsis flavida]PSL01056.1 uncharacterized protein DUF4439 [Murinocardiopsis flavida]
MSSTNEASEAPEPGSDTAALQKALRAEHAAVYGYGFIGAKTTGATRERCRAFLDDHRNHRETLRTELINRGAEPAVSKAAYAIPDDTSEQGLADYAGSLEETAAQAYLQLAGASDRALRELAGRSLQMTVVRALEWGADLAAFPGFPGGRL